MQIKTTMKYHLTGVRMASLKKKKLQITNADEGVEKKESTVENSIEVPQKTKNRINMWFSNSTPGHIPRQNNNLKRFMALLCL